MNPYPDESTCDICGGPMAINPVLSASRWTGAKIVHRDPDVCRGYLDAEKDKLQREREQLKKEKANAQVP